MEPFKNVFHRAGIATMGAVIARHDRRFREREFVQQATRDLESLELKQRSQQIFEALCHHLPQDFSKAAALIQRSLHPCCEGAPVRAETDANGIQGWLIMPLAEYAGRRGIDHHERALALLRELTMRFSSEFGIRHILEAKPTEALQVIAPWTADPNEHVRRLVSEGTRPRLPWGQRLREFARNPALTLPLLQRLRDDPAEYVRRSVANHLNDIAKDHPQLVLDLARDWHRKAPEPRGKLLRHALRNLLKEGHPQALALYQLEPPLLATPRLTLETPQVPLHGTLCFRVVLASTAGTAQRLRLDLEIFYQKANGTLAPKTRLWKEITLGPGEQHEAEKTLSFHPITTRTYHRGPHRIVLKANGAPIASADFALV